MSGHEDHSISLKTFTNVLLFLFFMTFVTVAISRVDLGVMNTFVAMVIASIKGFFVLAYFMHLKYEGILNRAMLAIGVFFLLVMFFLSFTDIITRVLHTSPL